MPEETPAGPRWRAFGAAADLDFDFGSPSRARLVTALLAACRDDAAAGAVAEDTVLALTLAGRIGALAQVAARSGEGAELTLDLTCPVPWCGASLQADVPYEWLLSAGLEAELAPAIEVELEPAARLRVRRPTGHDQQCWEGRGFSDAAQAERAMVASLCDLPESALTAEALAAVDAALEEHDPLTCFTVTAACPACGETQAHPIDLERRLLQLLQRRQHEMVREVHRLASRFGWDERTILALPAWRRRMYLQLIDREAE